MYDVYVEVFSLADKWEDLGLALRLRVSDVSTIANACRDKPKDCLKGVLTKWLQKGYNHQKHGSPTWRMLVKAIAEPTGGDNTALAEEVARNHQG